MNEKLLTGFRNSLSYVAAQAFKANHILKLFLQKQVENSCEKSRFYTLLISKSSFEKSFFSKSFREVFIRGNRVNLSSNEKQDVSVSFLM